MDSTLKETLEQLLNSVLSPTQFQALLVVLGDTFANRRARSLGPAEVAACCRRVEVALRVHCTDSGKRNLALERVERALGGDRRPLVSARGGHVASSVVPASSPAVREMSVPVASLDDVVHARMSAKEMAQRLGFSESYAVRIATAVSELARNIVFYATSGSVFLRPSAPPTAAKRGLSVIASDNGPGIAELEAVMSGAYKSTRGLGLGLRGVKQIMDEFQIESRPGHGTTVRCAKWLS